MYTHLQRWIWFLEEKLLSRRLANDEFIFPTIGSNSIVYPKQEISYDTIQVYINEFQEKAGVTGKLTTHSFRRGGAQYRFMYAPLGQRWTLSRIRWRGGWAKGEKGKRGKGENVRTALWLSSENLMHNNRLTH
jgi:hypothetical protein